MMGFEPDYRCVVDAARNVRPGRLPLYEHIINDTFIEKATGREFASLLSGDEADVGEYFREFCGFWRAMGYDTVSFEVCVTGAIVDGGALLGERKGPIQTRADFERYPWDEVEERFWRMGERWYGALRGRMPAGMKAVGGVGNGIFEISEDLVGYEQLCYMQADDVELLGRLYRRIGDMMVRLWTRFLERWGADYCVCRMGDDLGFKTGTLVSPKVIVEHIVPQYKRVIELVHGAGKPFLFHSCGRIFEVMEDVIGAGIDAKHSNEDGIAGFDEWIERYGELIGLFGGIDMDQLCRLSGGEVYAKVMEDGRRFREKANGFALGSGNSIPDYVPVEGYMAMVEAVKKIRSEENA